MNQSNRYSYTFSLPAPVDATFKLFSDPCLLNTLTPSWFDLEPQAHELQTLAPGVEITYRLRWRGIPLRWTSRIVDWEPPVRLTYEQVQGPYRWFRHEHLFEAEGTGTRVIDTVLYRAPGSRPIDRLLVRPDLKRIFRHREQAARLAFGAIQTRLPILEPYAADKPCTPQDGTA